MDILLIILAAICLLVGLAGCIVPILPGPPISYLGLLLLNWTKYVKFSTDFLLIWAAVVVIVTLLDYFLPPLMTKRFGGSKYATWGATIGLILGFFIFPPIGIILLPFFGALAGEFIYDNTNSAKVFKVALGSFVAFILGTGVKLIAAITMIYYSVKAFFV